jgi:hypothetical protein
MTTTTVHPITRPTWRSAVTSRSFLVHLLQMVVAMLAGMVVFMPLTMLVGDAAIEVQALAMATAMTAGMSAWMAWRRHSWQSIVEMGLAMYLAFVVLFPLLWLGALSSSGLMLLGHVLMAPAMVVAMLHRREEYLGGHRH